MVNLVLIQSLFLFLNILIIIILSMMIFSLLKNKKLMNKEEYLIIINQIFTLFIMCLSVIYIIFWYIGELFLFQKLLYKILHYFFNVYIIFIYVNYFMIILEYYYTYEYHIHYFSYLLKIDKNFKNYYNILFISIIIIISLFDISYCEIGYINDYFKELHLNSSSLFECNVFEEQDTNDNKNIFPFTLTIKFRGIILIALSILTIFYIAYFLWKIKEFYFNKINSLKLNLIIKLITNIIYLLYGILCTFGKGENFNILNSFLFLIIIFINNLILIIKYSLSRFVQIKLNKTIIGKIGYRLNKFINKKARFIPLTYSTAFFQSISSLLLLDSSYNTYHLALNPFEQELLLMYQNGIFIEDYYLNYFDQILNIITSSLYKLYTSEIFSAKEVNNQKLSKEMNISVSSINPGGISEINEINSSNLNEELFLSENLSSFTFYKNKVINDYSLFEEVLNDNDTLLQKDLRISINSYYTNSCVNNIFEKNYSSQNIANSLISHMLIKKRNTISSSSTSNQEIPPCNYYSLTASNAKEIYFKNLNNICLKTYDKRYTLEMFETSEKINEIKISISNGNNNNISELINKYFIYLEAKGINNTFLPLILGIFKIKINDFKSLLVIITDNSIVENAQVKNFTNWQLIKFKRKGFSKLASSRYSRNTIVEDDLIFKRVNWKENKINRDLKIKLNNYEEVKNIMLSDINFLKHAGCFKFYLLLMYYEYESYQKQETYKQNEVIKIKTSGNNKPEIINDILPSRFLYNDSFISDDSDEMNIKQKSNVYSSKKNLNDNKDNIEKKDNNNDNNENNENNDNNDNNNDNNDNNDNKEGNEIQLINDISDDINDNENGNNNIISYSGQINFNGYSGVFDNFNCLCFFTFENIFENQTKYQYEYDFYKDYLKKIMKYFTSFKEKDNRISNKGINIVKNNNN